MKRFLALALLAALLPFPSYAQDIPQAVAQAVVRVRCGNRQGSGVVINGEKGYVLTNAHILLDLETNKPDSCTVGFVRLGSTKPSLFYRATDEIHSYNEFVNRDFAVLKLGEALQEERLGTFPFVRTDEFSQEGDPIWILAYPSVANGSQLVTNGKILALGSGIISTDAEISPGASGGAGLNAENNLIGLSTRILYRQISPGIEELVEYQLVDIRNILLWMDTLSQEGHDAYVTHADKERYHGPASYFVVGSLSCTLLARTDLSDAVFCLRMDGTRTVFPNAVTFLSWFGDFSGVVTLSPQELAPYHLTKSVTIKPGTLVKIQTDPKVYLVSSIDGSLRWLKNEEIAKTLYGDGWAGFVKDIPDEFFAHYQLGAAIE